MNKKTLLSILFVFLNFNLLFSQLIQFNFNNGPYLEPSSIHPTIINSTFSLSSGTIGTHVTTGNYFSSEPYIEETGGWSQITVNDSKYFYVDVAAETGYKLTIDSVAFEFYVTGSGPSAVSILLGDSVLNTLHVVADSLYTFVHILTGITGLTNGRFKIAGWDNGSRSTTGGGAFRLDNFTPLKSQRPQYLSSPCTFDNDFPLLRQ